MRRKDFRISKLMLYGACNIQYFGIQCERGQLYCKYDSRQDELTRKPTPLRFSGADR